MRAAGAMLAKDALWVTGGYQSYARPAYYGLASTEIVRLDGSVTEGPDLPVATQGHCMVTMHDARVVIIGGYPRGNQSSQVYIFDGLNNTYTNGPSLLFDRYLAACTLFYSKLHGNRPVILAAGGGEGQQTTSEVFDYTVGNSWEKSKHIVCL